MSGPTSNYRGRFAPSPTGPLHLGSLIAALTSYLDARHHGGRWLVRMEDLDPPREESGAADKILHSLKQHGLHWDEDVMWQSQRAAAYDAALETLDQQGHLFRCDCTRAALGPNGTCVGQCRASQSTISTSYSLRVNTAASDSPVIFHDLLQGEQQLDIGRLLPDFIVHRKDGLYAYQLAVAVDDAAQEISHIIRGSDLLDSTPRQICLQQLLSFNTPSYGHLPVITTATGQKFSKQNHAPALKDDTPLENLRLALRFLQQPEVPQQVSGVDQLLTVAVTQWSIDTVPHVVAIPAREIGLEA